MNAGFLMWSSGVLLAGLFSLSAEAGSTLDRINRVGTVTLAHREGAVPFSYLDGNGKPIGYTVDICMKLVEAVRTALKRPDLKVGFVQVTPQNRFTVIRSGTADLECGPTTNTAERRKLVDFTVPNFMATARMIVKADSGIRDWSDLRGKRIVTTAGTTNAQSIAERNNVRALNITLTEATDDREAFQRVVSGKTDAFAMDDVLLYGLRAGMPHPDDYAITGKALTIEPYAVMFAKDDPEFKRMIDREMARIINSGEIFALYRKWFNSPIPPSGNSLDMPMNWLLRSSFQYPSDKVGD